MTIQYLAFVRLPTEKAHGLQIMKTCEAFAHAGARIELAIGRQGRGDPFATYGVKKNFSLSILRGPDLVSWGSLGFIFSLLWFSEVAARQSAFWEADIIYSRDALILLQYIFLRRTLVYEAHQKPNLVSRFVARRAYRLVVISRALASAYVAAGVPREKIIVAPDAVDPDFFSQTPERAAARAEVGLAGAEKVVLYLGHLYARKGADTLATAASRIPDTVFLFVGGIEKDIRRFTAIYGSTPNMQIVGYVPREKIPLYLAAADLLVLPSSAKDEDSARYGSPMKLFEYMASATPILASNVPALREVLTDDSAYFFKPDDAEDLARVASRVLADPARAARGETAREEAKQYSWEARARTILSGLA